jgi:choline dehydrogenase-like flavoprotein
MPDDSIKKRTYDAIVIGSGASGGWAAKELCDKGLKTLVLERGREVKHGTDYPTASKAPWEFEYRGPVPIEKRKDYQGARVLRAETPQEMVSRLTGPYDIRTLNPGTVMWKNLPV